MEFTLDGHVYTVVATASKKEAPKYLKYPVGKRKEFTTITESEYEEAKHKSKT